MDLSLTGSGYGKILSRSGRLHDRGGRSEADDFTMVSTSKSFRKGGEFNGSFSRGQGSGGYSVRLIQSSLQTWGSTADWSTLL